MALGGSEEVRNASWPKKCPLSSIVGMSLGIVCGLTEAGHGWRVWRVVEGWREVMDSIWDAVGGEIPFAFVMNWLLFVIAATVGRGGDRWFGTLLCCRDRLSFVLRPRYHLNRVYN